MLGVIGGTVVDLDERDDPGVLTDTGSAGLLGDPLPADQPLQGYLYDAEQPRFCLRNRWKGVTVENNEGTERHRPDRGYAGLALITDCRLLFVIGRDSGDQSITVPYTNVEAVRNESTLLGETLIVETDASTYRFPCWGTLDPVVEYGQEVVSVWSTVGEHVERAETAIERLAERLEGDPEQVLSLLDKVEDELTAASDAVASLSDGTVLIEPKIEQLRTDLQSLRRRAQAATGDELAERAADRWTDREYQEAFDDLEAADRAYERALSIEAETPPDDELLASQSSVRSDRELLRTEPRESAEFARQVATSADDLKERIRWWKTALERYDTVYTLDWGRDRQRFDLDREATRQSLVDAVRNLVDAYCDAALDHVDRGADYQYSNPRPASYEEAMELLDEAESLAQERVPDLLERVAAAREDVERRL